MLCKKVVNRIEVLASHNVNILEYFVEKAKQVAGYLKTLKGSSVNLRELMKFYKDRSADQLALFEMMERDEIETTGNVQNYVEFLEKSLIPDVRKDCDDFGAFFAKQRKALGDYQAVITFIAYSSWR